MAAAAAAAVAEDDENEGIGKEQQQRCHRRRKIFTCVYFSTCVPLRYVSRAFAIKWGHAFWRNPLSSNRSYIHFKRSLILWFFFSVCLCSLSLFFSVALVHQIRWIYFFFSSPIYTTRTNVKLYIITTKIVVFGSHFFFLFSFHFFSSFSLILSPTTNLMNIMFAMVLIMVVIFHAVNSVQAKLWWR